MPRRKSKTKSTKSSKQAVVPVVEDVRDLAALVNKKHIYANGDIVWAKFNDFPWWPGQIKIKKKDTGRKKKLPVLWFGDFNEREDLCFRSHILLFDSKLEKNILPSVQKPDTTAFINAAKEAVLVQNELKEERLHIYENDIDFEIDDETPKRRHSKRLAKKAAATQTKATLIPQKRKRSPVITRSIKKKKNEEIIKNVLTDYKSLSKEQQDFVNKRRGAFGNITQTHDAEDLTDFIAFEYYCYRNINYTDIEAKHYLASFWEDCDVQSIEDHIRLFERFRYKPPPTKKRRKN